MWIQFFAGLLLMVAIFAAGWAVCVKVRNYGFLDVLWSYGLVLLAPWYAWWGHGNPVRKWLFAGVALVWSLRLGTHILRRVWRHHPRRTHGTGVSARMAAAGDVSRLL